MINRRIILLISSLVVSWPLLALGASGEESAPQAVVEAAQEGLQRFLGAIPPGELSHFGFQSEEELSQTSLGEPFLVYTMYPREILAGVDGAPGTVGIHPTNMWQFPVLVDGTPRTILTVDQMSGRWEAVDLGGLSPVVEMKELAAQWPAREEYQLKYVHVFQTGSQFVCVTKGDDSRLVPLEWTARSLGMLGESNIFEYNPMDIPDAVTVLAPFVRAALVRMQD